MSQQLCAKKWNLVQQLLSTGAPTAALMRWTVLANVVNGG
jgi:hypothetical protein